MIDPLVGFNMSPDRAVLVLPLPDAQTLDRENLELVRELQAAKEELDTLRWVKDFLREHNNEVEIALLKRVADANIRIKSLNWVEDMANRYCNCGYLLPGSGPGARMTDPALHEESCGYRQRVRP